MKGTCPFGLVLFCVSKNAFDVLETKTSHNMRLFTDLFGYSTIISYFCRRICGVIYNILSRKVRIRYVYTRKRQLDGLPLGRF